MQTVTKEWLKALEVLKDVPEAQLQWWIDNSRHYELQEETYLFKAGENVNGTYVLISGKCRAFVKQAMGERTVRIFEAGEVMGYLPFSRGLQLSAGVMVIEKTQVMFYPIEKIKALVQNHYELTQALVHVMTSRVRAFTSQQQQNEKMMALGKLSAGLAHELNNPAAAIVRGSHSLLKHLQLSPETFKKLMAINVTPDDVDRVNNKMFSVLRRTEKPILTMMERSAMEDDLSECLEGHEVENSAEISENFIDFGFTCTDMDEFSEMIPPNILSPVLNWINNNLVTEKMVTDIQDSSQRIEKLVNSIKNFTHMDRDHDKEFANIHNGIKNTLTMLSYKFKKGNVELVEDYDLSIPLVNAFVGELNQVWTNLIDNALDAMEVNKKGKLEIITQKDKENVVVSIVDNGPGIPESIKSQIFDPFFTTKEIGKGTGLGLDVVTRIVDQHKGVIKVDSVPGRTVFEVCFPINGTPVNKW